MKLVELDRALANSGCPAWRPSSKPDSSTPRLRSSRRSIVAMLVSDELVRRQDRLLARRIKDARFRDPESRSTPSTSTSTRR